MANELELRIIALAEGISTDVKSLRNKQGVDALNTTAQNISGAINELHLALGNAGAQIDDTATNGNTIVTWSADKIFDEIEVAKQVVIDSLVDGAGSALDTFKELQDALGNDPNFATTLATTLSNKVDFSSPQTLTAAQRLQACENIGVGNPNTDFLAAYIAVRDS